MCTTTIKILKTNSLVDFCEAAGELDGEDKELVVDDEEDWCHRFLGNGTSYYY